MQRARVFLIVASIAFGMLWAETLAAASNVGTKLPVEKQLAQTGDAQKAKTTLLLEQDLAGLPGFKVQIVLVEGPPGWIGGRHYHPGHIFGYVLEGTYILNFEDLTSQAIPANGVFYETPKQVMRSRNGSATEVVKNVVFHILRKGQPPTVSVK